MTKQIPEGMSAEAATGLAAINLDPMLFLKLYSDVSNAWPTINTIITDVTAFFKPKIGTGMHAADCHATIGNIGGLFQKFFTPANLQILTTVLGIILPLLA